MFLCGCNNYSEENEDSDYDDEAEPQDLVIDEIFHVDTADVDVYEAFNPVVDNLEQQYFKKLPPVKKPIKLLVDKNKEEEESKVPQLDPVHE